MGLDISFKIIDKKTPNIEYLEFEISDAWFLIPWCEKKLHLSEKDIKEGTFETGLSTKNICKLKNDILKSVKNMQKYKKFFSDKHITIEELHKMTELIKIIHKLELFDTNKVDFYLEMDW